MTPGGGITRWALVTAALGSVLWTTAGGLDAASASTGSASIAPTPLATSVETGGASWATVPMGRLDEALNTFWQLFYRTAAKGGWTNEVEATATATNGGLVLAASGTGGLTVGIRPSANLTYTPLITTGASAGRWENGLIDAALQARPDALSVSGSGAALALVGAGSKARVLESDDRALRTWHPLVTLRGLSSTSAGRSCRPVAVTSVGFVVGEGALGTACSTPGTPGLFLRTGPGWRHAPLTVPESLSRDRFEVLALQASSGGTEALLEASGGGRAELLAAWSTAKGTWTVSAPRPLDGARVASYGPAGADTLFVLTRTSSGSAALATVSAQDRTWRELPSPPVGTATVAFVAPTVVSALVPGSTSLAVWTLSGDAETWTSTQRLHVAIQFGSSAA